MQPLGLLLGPLDSQDVWLEILRMGTKVECVGSQGPLGSKTYCLILTSLEGGGGPAWGGASSLCPPNRSLMGGLPTLQTPNPENTRKFAWRFQTQAFLSFFPFIWFSITVRWSYLEARGELPPVFWFLIGSSLHQICSHLTTSGRTWEDWGLTRSSSSTTSGPLAVPGKSRVTQGIPWQSSG